MESPQSPQKAYLKAESFHLKGGQGFVPGDGDSVFLDRRFLGRTPWEGDVEAGWHSVRIASSDGRDVTEVFSVSAGQNRYVVSRLGLQTLPEFTHRPPDRVLLQGPVLLSVTIRPPADETIRDPQVFVIRGGGEAKAADLAPVDPARGIYVAALDESLFEPNQRTRYYFACRNAGGTPAASEIYDLVPVKDSSQLVSSD
jgi:hypothetical protein